MPYLVKDLSERPKGSTFERVTMYLAGGDFSFYWQIGPLESALQYDAIEEASDSADYLNAGQSKKRGDRCKFSETDPIPRFVVVEHL